MNETEITNVNDMRTAIAKAKYVMVHVRFGTNESWSQITKTEARALVSHLDLNATPAECEMYSGTFGMVRGNTFYMG